MKRFIAGAVTVAVVLSIEAAEKPKAAGVWSVDEPLAKGETPKGREELAAWCGVSAAQKAIGEKFPRKEFHNVVLQTGNASPAVSEPVIDDSITCRVRTGPPVRAAFGLSSVDS